MKSGGGFGGTGIKFEEAEVNEKLVERFPQDIQVEGFPCYIYLTCMFLFSGFRRQGLLWLQDYHWQHPQ
jgi:hypothetical protein